MTALLARFLCLSVCLLSIVAVPSALANLDPPPPATATSAELASWLVKNWAGQANDERELGFYYEVTALRFSSDDGILHVTRRHRIGANSVDDFDRYRIDEISLPLRTVTFADLTVRESPGGSSVTIHSPARLFVYTLREAQLHYWEKGKPYYIAKGEDEIRVKTGQDPLAPDFLSAL